MEKHEVDRDMKALVFHGPYDIRLETRPIPQILEPTDVVIKTKCAAFCGSELHRYRGHSKVNMEPGYVCGHEGAGIVHAIGSAIQNFKLGDYVVAPFTTSCGSCVNCKRGITGRCSHGTPFGGTALDGSQAEYFRVPMADTTLYPAPVELGDLVVLMTDIFPTGFNGARMAFQDRPQNEWSSMSIAVVGCGPVAVCAIISALEYQPKQIFAIDSIPERLERARSLGCKPINFQNEDVKATVLENTGGNGVDAVIELVGLSPALKTAYDILAIGGRIASVGVHGGEMPITAADCYNKNLTIQFGRCSVRAVFEDALAALLRNKSKIESLNFLDVTLKGLDASYKSALERFDKGEVNKVVMNF